MNYFKVLKIRFSRTSLLNTFSININSKHAHYRRAVSYLNNIRVFISTISESNVTMNYYMIPSTL